MVPIRNVRSQGPEEHPTHEPEAKQEVPTGALPGVRLSALLGLASDEFKGNDETATAEREESGMSRRTCARCGLPFTAHGKGRPAKYCSKNCQMMGPCAVCGLYCASGRRRDSDRRCMKCRTRESERDFRKFAEKSFRDWVDRFGCPPVANEWNLAHARKTWKDQARLRHLERIHSQRKWPTFSAIIYYFGGWNQFIEEMGHAPRPVGGVAK